MATANTIVVDFEWRQVDPDGSACRWCGDMCFLSMFEGVAIMFGKDHRGNITSAMNTGSFDPRLVMCSPCFDAAGLKVS